MFIEFDRSGKEGFLALKINLKSHPGKIQGEITNIRASLYKSDKIYSSVYLDQEGGAMFSRIKDGEYSLELLIGDRSLGMIELSIDKANQ